MHLTEDQRSILRQMASGWRPFSIQLSGEAPRLFKCGLVCTGYDDKGRVVVEITDAGRAAIERGKR